MMTDVIDVMTMHAACTYRYTGTGIAINIVIPGIGTAKYNISSGLFEECII